MSRFSKIKARTGQGGGKVNFSYEFKDKDPICYIIARKREIRGFPSYEAMSREVNGLTSSSTFRNMVEGKTRKPQHASAERALRSLGFHTIVVETKGWSDMFAKKKAMSTKVVVKKKAAKRK